MSNVLAETAFVNDCLRRLQVGDQRARDELLSHTAERLLAITRKVKRDFPQLQRWEQTEDVCQNAAVRLCRALQQVDVQDAQHYYRLAAAQIRRELIDLVRHWQGPQGAGRHHQTQPPRGRVEGDTRLPDLLEQGQETHDPRRVAEWCEFHEQVEKLPQPEREAFDLLYYHGLSQDEAAEALKVDVRTVKRRWRAARLALYEVLGEGPSLEA